MMIIEGQGALRYPAGPFASPDGVRRGWRRGPPAFGRTHHDGLEHLASARIPSLASRSGSSVKLQGAGAGWPSR